ncbi:conjugal transfer protein [Streptomyces sp. MS1.AVA.3]|uniref:conjugal transfer protein n=1 Tax=Streptomyces decoyicus TaxID=249567 RepID=UPI0030BE0932
MSVWRKVLNLPVKKTEGGEEFAEALAKHAGTTPDTAKEEAKNTQPLPSGGDAWAEEQETSGRAFARRAGRITVWAVIGLAAVTGVRTWISPSHPDTSAQRSDPQAEARRNHVPVEEAAQVAARFARNYMTWSEAAPEAREKELATDLPKGADTRMGWNGKGTQLVAQTVPGAVIQAGGKRGRVQVDVRVSVTTGKPGKQHTTSSWRALEVPVASAGSRVIVTGQPALVGMPAAVGYHGPDTPDNDAKLADSTRSTVTAFLKAWAAGAQDQASAPGSQIPPLGSGMQLDGVDIWTVDTGSGDVRTGTATVRWKVAGAVLQQTYRITIAKVSANSHARWQVAAVAANAG